MRIIATLDEPTAGDVFLDGISVVEEPEKAQRLVGYVPDALPAHRDISVHEYLDFFARAYGIQGANPPQAVESDRGIHQPHRHPRETPQRAVQGHEERVSVARALVHDPAVLDHGRAGRRPRPARPHRIARAAQGAVRQGKAILISSHILTELAEICNGAVIIERGKILETGTIDDVLKKSAPRRTVAIRLLEGNSHQNPQLLKELLQTPFVENAREVVNEIHFELAGDESAACDILGTLIGKKFKVIEFRQTKANLEDIFMNVTKGGVQ